MERHNGAVQIIWPNTSNRKCGRIHTQRQKIRRKKTNWEI